MGRAQQTAGGSGRVSGATVCPPATCGAAANPQPWTPWACAHVSPPCSGSPLRLSTCGSGSPLPPVALSWLAAALGLVAGWPGRTPEAGEGPEARPEGRLPRGVKQRGRQVDRASMVAVQRLGGWPQRQGRLRCTSKAVLLPVTGRGGRQAVPALLGSRAGMHATHSSPDWLIHTTCTIRSWPACCLGLAQI